MSTRDNKACVQVVHLGNLALSGTTPAASAWVDTRGFDSCTIVAVSNTITDAGTSAGFTLTAQHGDDSTATGAADIDAADTPDGNISVTETVDGNDNTVSGGVGYVGQKRYLRFNAVGTTLTDADVSVVAYLSNAHRAETTFVGASVAVT